MKRLFVQIALAFAVTCPVLANAQGITVRGVPNCGDWVKGRGNNNNWGSDQYFLLGMLNGINATNFHLSSARPPLNVFGKSTPKNEQLFLWMDKYCRENPLKDVMDGAFQLFGEITKSRPLDQ